MQGIAWNFGNFTLFAEQRLLMAEGRPVPLGGRALDILIALVEYAGQFVGREELIARIWGGRVVEEINLRVQMAGLRRALGDDVRSDPRFIVNLPTKGYCFVAPVTRVREAPAAASTPRLPAVAPTSLATLVGRDAVVAELGEQLQGCSFVSVVGPGGIGKSAVAVQVAFAAVSRYPQGVCHVDLGGLSDLHAALSRIADALGSRDDVPQTAQGIADSVRGREILLVLDGCEGVIDMVAVLAEEILAKAPNVHVLVTSREPLRIPGERVHRLGPLCVPPPDHDSSLRSALSFSSVQLFSERSHAASGNFDPSPADAPLMMEICRRLDGVPLALELAAHRVEHLGLRGILAQLDAGFDVLCDERRMDVPLQQSLRASFNWSFASLFPEEQRILCRLSVFAGGFSLARGAQLAAVDDATEAAAELIGQLATKSLVSVENGSSGVHYRLLGATKAYARTRLRVQGDHASVARKHAELTVRLLQADGADRAGRSSRTRPWRCASCLDEVRSALDWLAAEPGEEALHFSLLAASVELWFEHSAVAEYCRRATEALGRSASPVATADLIRVQIALGHARLHVFGPDDETMDILGRATTMSEGSGRPGEHLMARWGLWLAQCLNGRYAEALAKAEEYESLSASARPGTGIASDRMLMVALQEVGRNADARARGERVLASILLMPRSGTGAGLRLEHEAVARSGLARVLWLQGRPDSAMAMAMDAVVMARSAMHDLTSCICLHGLVVVALWSGQRDQARRAALELSEMATKHRLAFWAAWGKFDLDAVGFVAGEAVGANWRQPICGIRQLELMATFRTDLVEPEVLVRADDGEAPWCEPEVLRARGCQAVLMATEQARRQGLAWFERALQLARTQGALAWELRIATSVAAVADHPGEVSTAIDLLAATLERFEEGRSTPDVRSAETLLAALRAR